MNVHRSILDLSTAAPTGLKEIKAALHYRTSLDATAIPFQFLIAYRNLTVTLEIAATAARLIVEEGLEYGPAKRRAVKQLGLSGRASLPDNDEIEQEVIDYLALFCSDTQPGELRALRELAVVWMERMAQFRPHLSGAVWRGTATRLNDIYIQMFCDDSKSAEISLIDYRVQYVARSVTGFNGDTVDALSVHSMCEVLKEEVGVHLMVYDRDDLRGALKPDTKGRTARGDLVAVRRLLG